MNETWDLWIPGVGATGWSFGRSVIDSTAGLDGLLVHAAPRMLSVTVRDADGRTMAEGVLDRGSDSPLCRIKREGESMSAYEVWPSDSDIGRVVLLPGGEAGILRQWWNNADHTAWRWNLELSNQV